MFRRQADAEGVVDCLAVGHGDVDVALPASQRIGVAVLQVHHGLPGAVGEVGVDLEALAGLGVEALQVGEAIGVFAEIVEMRDQTSKLRSPVADVVLADDRVAERFENTRHGIADDGAAQVVYLHLLGEIRVRIVDDHALTRRCLNEGFGQCPAQQGVVDRQADETRARDCTGAGDAFEVRRLDQRRCKVARFAAQALGRRHRAVGLVVAELGARRGTYEGCRAVRPDFRQGGGQAFGQQPFEVHSGATSSACQPRCRSTAKKLTAWPSSSPVRSLPTRRMER